MQVPPSVLYIASGGLSDPLIVSQVLAYLRPLRCSLAQCHLITFERTALTPDTLSRRRQELRDEGIYWYPIRAANLWRSLGIWRDIHRGYRLGLKIIRDSQVNLVHARSFVPGNIGLRLKKATGVPLLYDMRGFWAIEKWAKGTIRSQWMRTYAQRLERRLWEQADHLVSLTDAGKRWLRGWGIETPIDIIPCCVDTTKFTAPAHGRRSAARFISVGSLGPGYLPDAVFGVFQAARARWPDASLEILTRTSRETIDRAAARVGCPIDDVQIRSVLPDQVPAILQQADAGLCLIEPSEAKIASCPTKLAEYLACGLPVIANGEIGDVAEIVTARSIGVIVRSFHAAAYQRAISELADLLLDTSLRARCRAVAEEVFSLTLGVAAYRSIYERIAATPRSAGNRDAPNETLPMQSVSDFADRRSTRANAPGPARSSDGQS